LGLGLFGGWLFVEEEYVGFDVWCVLDVSGELDYRV